LAKCFRSEGRSADPNVEHRQQQEAQLFTYYQVAYTIRYDTIRYDSVYLTCSKKLTGSQLSLPHGTNKKLKCETKNKMMSVIGPVQSRYHEAFQ